jgi:hypothetical protein
MVGFGGEATGYIGTDELGRNRIEDIWPVWFAYDLLVEPVFRSHSYCQLDCE